MMIFILSVHSVSPILIHTVTLIKLRSYSVLAVRTVTHQRLQQCNYIPLLIVAFLSCLETVPIYSFCTIVTYLFILLRQ
jgi:hypothetical protein